MIWFTQTADNQKVLPKSWNSMVQLKNTKHMKTNLFPKTKILILVISTTLFLSSCRFGLEDPYPIGQSNNIVKEKIPLVNFERLEVSNALNIYVTKGSNFSIIAEGDSYDLADLEAFVSNKKLVIKYKNFIKRRYEMNLYITMPHLTEANFSGASIAEISNFNENYLAIRARGASDIFVDSDATNWDIELSGASILEIYGRGRNLDLNASGSSDFYASKLFIDNIDLNISGASKTWLFAYNEIIGSASGASEVIYSGNPLVDIRLSGASNVSRY